MVAIPVRGIKLGPLRMYLEEVNLMHSQKKGLYLRAGIFEKGPAKSKGTTLNPKP